MKDHTEVFEQSWEDLRPQMEFLDVQNKSNFNPVQKKKSYNRSELRIGKQLEMPFSELAPKPQLKRSDEFPMYMRFNQED